MSNATDLMIVCLDEDSVVETISSTVGINFLKLSNGTNAGGTEDLFIAAYGSCYRSLGKA